MAAPIIQQTQLQGVGVKSDLSATSLAKEVGLMTTALKGDMAKLTGDPVVAPVTTSGTPSGVMPQPPFIQAHHSTLQRKNSLSDFDLKGLSREQKRSLVSIRQEIKALVRNPGGIWDQISPQLDTVVKDSTVKMSDLVALYQPSLGTVMAQIDRACPPDTHFTKDEREAIVSHLIGLELAKLIPKQNESTLAKGVAIGAGVLSLIADGLAFVPGVNFLSLPLNLLATFIRLGARMVGDTIQVVDENGQGISKSAILNTALEVGKMVAQAIPGASTVASVLGGVADVATLVTDIAELAVEAPSSSALRRATWVA